ncbi:hypothetical protein AB205_0140130 [Aquarana catesbeiana]|uniref:Uncharacterized protein n=1 Tax=Aquarana catesbeiana TaxID=8400 RepID=A0A2G9RIA3_AQUCT|nr:hypothetical protein AB205_0140130 [Aquarana catesbeiana]
MPPAEPLLISGVPSRVPPYIRCPQQSPSSHQVSPAESLLISGAPSRVSPYIRFHSQQSPSLHQVSLANGVPRYVRCPQPAESPATRCPHPSESLPYIRCPLFTRVQAAGDLASVPLQKTSWWRPNGRTKRWSLGSSSSFYRTIAGLQ